MNRISGTSKTLIKDRTFASSEFLKEKKEGGYTSGTDCKVWAFPPCHQEILLYQPEVQQFNYLQVDSVRYLGLKAQVCKTVPQLHFRSHS